MYVNIIQREFTLHNIKNCENVLTINFVLKVPSKQNKRAIEYDNDVCTGLQLRCFLF